ncbi:hypothetical protein BU16DRAFT_356406 [Lophium mytilinum]|uniref:Uncharacterized protein n=1 Tax=Lophium mytilinum TaxID=390894 RepID=A0A6A6QXK6_9PEZI|nr:hypothetical protein BU16DRAFT_356406 [Lophium mytilinum]
MLPVFGPHELPRAQPVTWKKTVWQKGNVAPAVNDGPATQQTKRISFRLPSVQVPADRMPTYQTPAQQAMAGYTPPYQMRALQTLTHHTPVCQERDAETDDYGY